MNTKKTDPCLIHKPLLSLCKLVAIAIFILNYTQCTQCNRAKINNKYRTHKKEEDKKPPVDTGDNDIEEEDKKPPVDTRDNDMEGWDKKSPVDTGDNDMEGWDKKSPEQLEDTIKFWYAQANFLEKRLILDQKIKNIVEDILNLYKIKKEVHSQHLQGNINPEPQLIAYKKAHEKLNRQYTDYETCRQEILKSYKSIEHLYSTNKPNFELLSILNDNSNLCIKQDQINKDFCRTQIGYLENSIQRTQERLPNLQRNIELAREDIEEKLAFCTKLEKIQGMLNSSRKP